MSRHLGRRVVLSIAAVLAGAALSGCVIDPGDQRRGGPRYRPDHDQGRRHDNGPDDRRRRDPDQRSDRR